jgi:hypothetical protein
MLRAAASHLQHAGDSRKTLSALHQANALWPSPRRCLHRPQAAADGEWRSRASQPKESLLNTRIAGDAVAGLLRADELSKNFEHGAVEERLYGWRG